MTAASGTVLEHDIGPTGLLAVRVHSSDLHLRAVDGSTVRVSDPTGSLERSVTVERAPGSLSLSAGRGISLGGPVEVDVEAGVSEAIREAARAVEHARRAVYGRSGKGPVHAGPGAPDLEIDVPRGATVVIETASGDVVVDGLTGDQRYRTASGEILLREVSGQLAVDAVSGDVSIAAIGDSVIGARTVSGDLDVQAGTVRSLRISTTSGDMRIEGRLAGDGPFAIESVSGDTILAPVGGVTVAVKSVTGDIRSDVVSTTEGNRGSRTVTVGDGGPRLTLRSISGDLRLVRPSGPVVVSPLAPEVPAPPLPPRPPAAPEPPETPTVAIEAPAVAADTETETDIQASDPDSTLRSQPGHPRSPRTGRDRRRRGDPSAGGPR